MMPAVVIEILRDMFRLNHNLSRIDKALEKKPGNPGKKTNPGKDGNPGKKSDGNCGT